jgi:hypothetical protein
MEHDNATKHQVILDVGKQKKKRIKQLKRGEGDLLEEVRLAVAHNRAKSGNSSADVIPVVIVFSYDKKTKKKRALPMMAPIPFL